MALAEQWRRWQLDVIRVRAEDAAEALEES